MDLGNGLSFVVAKRTLIKLSALMCPDLLLDPTFLHTEPSSQQQDLKVINNLEGVAQADSALRHPQSVEKLLILEYLVYSSFFITDY